MSARGLHVHGVGHFHPENVLDNRFLEELDIGTNEEWILERVGIRTRRTVLPLDYIRKTRNVDVRAGQEAALYSNVETGRRAALHALSRAGLQPSDIGLVVAGGCCPEMAIPSESCRIAAALGIEAPGIDVNSACSSFGAQLHLLAGLARGGALPRFVLIVNPENTTRVIDYSDRATTVLWGDGTSAAVVSAEEPARVAIVSTTLASSPSGWQAVIIPRSGHFAQQGNAVQRFAIKTSIGCLEGMLPAARARAAETGGTVRFIGHQANRLMLDGIVRRLALDDAQHWHNVVDYGNTGAAGAPTVLSQHWDELAAGDQICLVVVGAGLTWSSVHLEVGK
ncbi:MAG: ketoacyl-ACP synthase III [Deltaproteobacteria bacterium]|nr:ketoacyl-ACP synthase III [Deltaproteobacteria bacterium]